MPYKNVETLIRAMEHLPGILLAPVQQHCPAARNRTPKAHAGGQRGGVPPWCQRPEYQELLRRATALVSLSRAEGYGLPLVEAMSVGTPVVATDMPIFREVGAARFPMWTPQDPQDCCARGDANSQILTTWHAASRQHWNRAQTIPGKPRARQLLDLAESVMENAKKRRSTGTILGGARPRARGRCMEGEPRLALPVPRANRCALRWGKPRFVNSEEPLLIFYLLPSSVAQLAEHSTVNRRVTGSSPVGGAQIRIPVLIRGRGFLSLSDLIPWVYIFRVRELGLARVIALV